VQRKFLLAISTVVFFALLPFNAQAGRSYPPRAPRPVTTISPFGPLVSLPGSLPRLAATRPIGFLVPDRTITFSIGLRLRNASGLQTLLYDLYTPASALYHHWLSTAQFQARFAPSPAERKAISSWLSSRALQAAENCDNLLITAYGRVDRVEAAFGTNLFLYREGGRTVFANASPVHVPRGLAPFIISVSGLTNAYRPHPLGATRLPAQQVNGFTPSDVANFYGFTQLYNQGHTGSGRTIALAEFTGIDNGDITTYDTQFNLPAPSLQLVPITVGGTVGGATINVKEQGEAEMDIEIAHGMAPGATLLVYQAPDSTNASNVYCHIVQDNRADVMTASYGLDERGATSAGTNEVILQDSLFQQAAAQGQSFLAASGDNGAYDVPDYDPTTAPLQVDFPASDPWITGVGGTSIFQNPDGSTSETAWSDASHKAGSGGGLSTYWRRPTWQTGPGVDNKYSNGFRQVPDIAALGDQNNPGYQIYSVDNQGNLGWGITGGTSASSPLWAAFTAIADGAIGHRAGFLNPPLYTLGASANPPFHDITQGDNLYYPATPGWDFATGWGSINGPALLNALAGSAVYTPPPTTPTPTPTPTSTPRSTATPTHTPVPPKPKVLKCKKGYKKVKKKGKQVCQKIKKR
jgi:kumamolisin